MRKLPVIAAAKHVANTVIGNIDVAFKLSWPWILVLLAMTILLALFGSTQVTMVNGVAVPNAVLSSFIFLSAMVSMVAFASIAVNWHRYILLNEIPSGAKILRTDGVVWRYIGNSFLALLIVMIPYAILGLPLMADLTNRCCSGTFNPAIIQDIPFMLASFWPMLILMIFILVLLYRLTSKLPAVALGRRDYGFGAALHDTAGNTLQLIGLAVILMVGLWVPSWLLGKLNETVFSALGIPGFAINVLLQLALQWLSLIIGISLLTSLYGFFAEKRDF